MLVVQCAGVRDVSAWCGLGAVVTSSQSFHDAAQYGLARSCIGVCHVRQGLGAASWAAVQG